MAALPYDVYNREEAALAVKENPLSFLNIDRAETQFGPEVESSMTVCMIRQGNCWKPASQREAISQTKESIIISTS